jgi:hypothetical protein
MRGPALELNRHILERIASRPGSVWTPVDFLDFGSRASVDKALQRMVRSGKLRRIDRGLYDQPRLNTLTGNPTVPDHRAVIDAVVRRDQVRVVLDGLTAANDLGLTTAVPARVIVMTDARLRPIKLGNLEIRFHTAAASRLYWAGRPAMHLVQALQWLHDLLPGDKDRIVSRMASIIAERPEIRQDLHDGFHTLPIWMQGVVREILSSSAIACDEGHGRAKCTGESSSESDVGNRLGARQSGWRTP